MLVSWIFISWFLQMPTLICTTVLTSCITEEKRYRFHNNGSVVIGAFFPIYLFFPERTKLDWKANPSDVEYLATVMEQNYQLLLAMLFAIEEINRNSHLLPNTSLGIEVYNLPFSEMNVLQTVFNWFTGLSTFSPNYFCGIERKSAALLIGIRWKTSELIGTLLHLYKFPQLTFGAFDPGLTEGSQFQSVYQVAPKDTSLPRGIASLMLHFSWNWVGLLITSDHTGAQILSDMRRELDRNGVCIAFVETIPILGASGYYNSVHTVVHIQESSSNVIVIYGDITSLLTVMVNKWGKFLSRKVWVMNSKWGGSRLHEYTMLDSFHGSFIFSPHHGEILGFPKFMQEATPIKYPEDIYLHVFWNIYFNCSLLPSNCEIFENCLPNASLELLPGNIFDMAMSEESYNVTIHSLHEMSLNQVQVQTEANKDRTIFFPWQVISFFTSLKRIQVKNPVGDLVVLDWKKKSDVEYDINNIWNFPTGLSLQVKVGTFSPRAPQGQHLSIFQYMIQWPTGFSEVDSIWGSMCSPLFRPTVSVGMDQCIKCPETHYVNAEKRHCLQKTVTFLAYDDPLGKGLTLVSLGFSALTAVVIGVFVNHRDTPIVRANNRSLSYILLFTLMLCFLCPLLFIDLPNTATCILQQNAFGLLFTVVLSTVLAKTITVVMAFHITAPGRRTRWLLISQAPNFIIPICTLTQVLLSAIWLGTSPPFIDMDAHSEHGHIIILCNKGSAIAFYCSLAYLGVMAFSSYLMAFLYRNLPDTFNEAKFLSFSMLVFCSVWVTFLPVYHSTKGKVMLSMEVFSILASSAGILCLIFAPKCYIILLKPERNSVHHVRDKRDGRSKNLL
uniref:G-protein coupled receptors family 3 profile domain-containing protein n=1 Tax=Cricetulus griseus TaxID=10029 RepID=A0A8C2N3B4_CRIGR